MLSSLYLFGLNRLVSDSSQSRSAVGGHDGGVFFRSPNSEIYLSLVALLHHTCSFSFVIITSYVFVVCCHDVCHQ